MTDGLREPTTTLEGCICGECFYCPDGYHDQADGEPCICTPDCILGDPELDPENAEVFANTGQEPPNWGTFALN